ncbi:Protein ABIL4 [Linum perenne]
MCSCCFVTLDFSYLLSCTVLYTLNSKPLSWRMDSQHEPDYHHPQPPCQFIKSLQELKELQCQLRCAADYWEKSFRNAKEKKKVVEGTKEYVCRAVVAVVDHLGSVSVGLNTTISDKTTGFSRAELRIDSLKQRLLSYELYAQKIGLSRTRWFPILPKLHRRYMSTHITDRDASPVAPRKIGDNKLVFEAQELPLFLYTCSNNASSANCTNFSMTMVPVGDTITVCGKGQTATFHFQLNSYDEKKKNKHGGNCHRRRWSGGRTSSDVMSLVRPTKRPS